MEPSEFERWAAQLGLTAMWHMILERFGGPDA